MGRRKLKGVAAAAVDQDASAAPETKCPHVHFASFAQNTRSLLNPRLWACSVCGTTERVWACLFCSFMGCGRDVGGHALQHHQTTKHAVTMEVNDMYVHCYICNCYVLSDNIFNDLEVLRCNMRALATRSFEQSHTRSGHVMRIESTANVHSQDLSNLEEEQDMLANQIETADTHFKAKLLVKVINAWHQTAHSSKAAASSAPRVVPVTRPCSSSSLPGASSTNYSVVGDSKHEQPIAPPVDAPSVRRKPKSLASGVTGLRNLGNTCYMNSVLQALGHLTFFRECFRQMMLPVLTAGAATEGIKTTPSSARPTFSRLLSTPQERAESFQRDLFYARQTTIECFNQLTMSFADSSTKHRLSTHSVGLNGGDGGATSQRGRSHRVSSTGASKPASSMSSPVVGQSQASQASQSLSLVTGLHQLFRVTWSGKWTVATPSALLVSIWRQIPSFRGHEQQDAQEFLSHLLERLELELGRLPTTCVARLVLPKREIVVPSDIIPAAFRGKLLSEVTCQTCGTRTKQREVFYDISLDFPDRYQAKMASSRSCKRTGRPPCQEPCDLKDILEKFVACEDLGPIFLCNMCLGVTSQAAGVAKRRVSRSASVITAGQRYQPAVKQLRLERPPEVLRLHLKRFRWFHSSREKINVHVHFPLELDIRPYCVPPPTPATRQPQRQCAPPDGPSSAAATATAAAATKPANARPVSSRTARGRNPLVRTAAVDHSTSVNPAAPSQPCNSSGGGDGELVSLEDVLDLSEVFGKRPASRLCNNADDNGGGGGDDHDGDDTFEGPASQFSADDYIYDLSSIIMHHGTGFNRGHYTSYCWNEIARSWVHCNDARLTLCSEAEVLQSQAYILFYVRRHGRAGTGYSPFSANVPMATTPISPSTLSPLFAPSSKVTPTR
eukprot:scpid60094/ scgid21257/ Ubiquitin carboxyl-terminal hydrolase 44; Deubiquitinating enzyme 44; Ubiquitin thioesterase 44; Ubiquitin-specific-processing protease 44